MASDVWRNLNESINRISKYKGIVSPFRLDLYSHYWKGSCETLVKILWKFHIIFTWDFTWFFTNYVKKCCSIFMWKSCGNHVKRVFPFTWCFTLLKSMKKMWNRQRWVGDPWVWNYKWKLSISQYIINRYNKIREEPTGSIEPMP